MITQLNPRNLGPTVRATNERLMVAFIDAACPAGWAWTRGNPSSSTTRISCSITRWPRCPMSARSASCITRRRFAIGQKASRPIATDTPVGFGWGRSAAVREVARPAQAFDVSKRVAGHGGAARTRQMLYPLHNPPPATKLVVLSSIASSRW